MRALVAWTPCAVALGLAGCLTEPVDTSGLASITDYATWHRLDIAGPLPGHGESYRIFYVNDVARSYPHAGRYPIGTTIVKEIHDLEHEDGLPAPGGLQYTAVMRKLVLDERTDGGTGLPLDAGWLFTELGDEPGHEQQLDLCWAQCHRQARWDGAFLDYGE